MQRSAQEGILERRGKGRWGHALRAETAGI